MMSKSLARKLAARGHTEAKSAEAISQGIHGLLIELHNTLRGLSPVDLEQTPLTIALERLCETVSDQSGIACVYKGDEKADVENPDTALHLYRIAQEAIHNAIRHGNPTCVGVRLLKEDGGIVLEIDDNGSGFNAEAPTANGMGLRTIQHRSRLIGATLEVKSVEKKGTTVRCKYGSGELTHEHQPEEE